MTNFPQTTFRRAFGFNSVFGCLFILTVLSLASAAHAAEAPDDDRLVISSADALSSDDMETSRGSGGTNISVSASQTMNSTTSGNTLDVGGSLTNGNISSVTFSGSGFGSYVMNTGNNSTINSGVSLSVLMMQ
ncbi:MAG: hypothetical protein WCD70_06235 [Alphaproteobacteria bacterium]